MALPVGGDENARFRIWTISLQKHQLKSRISLGVLPFSQFREFAAALTQKIKQPVFFAYSLAQLVPNEQTEAKVHCTTFWNVWVKFSNANTITVHRQAILLLFLESGTRKLRKVVKSRTKFLFDVKRALDSTTVLVLDSTPILLL